MFRITVEGCNSRTLAEIIIMATNNMETKPGQSVNKKLVVVPNGRLNVSRNHGEYL
jgi:hypothetical protein